MTALPGSHDGDVGLPDYVGGWMAHGHPGYHGYPWYRRVVTVVPLCRCLATCCAIPSASAVGTGADRGGLTKSSGAIAPNVARASPSLGVIPPVAPDQCGVSADGADVNAGPRYFSNQPSTSRTTSDRATIA